MNRIVVNYFLLITVALCISFYFLISGISVGKMIFRDVRFMLQNPSLSYDDKMRIFWWQVYDYFEFVKQHTPEHAVIVTPPQERPWLTSGNTGIALYFLYPRKIISGGLYSLPLDKSFDFVMIHKGEWNDAPMDKYNWPKIYITADKIWYLDPNDKSINVTYKDFDPKDDRNKGALGLIQIKK